MFSRGNVITPKLPTSIATLGELPTPERKFKKMNVAGITTSKIATEMLNIGSKTDQDRRD
jgi:hypothetical protein